MTTEDLPALRAILQDDEVMYAYGGAFREEEVLAWLKKMQTSYRENGYGLWAVVLKETGRMIGQCGLTNQTPLEKTVLEVGYLFAKEFWHRGFAAEAATVKDYSFRAFMPMSFAIIRCTNLAPRAVAKRLGMFVPSTSLSTIASGYASFSIVCGGMSRLRSAVSRTGRNTSIVARVGRTVFGEVNPTVLWTVRSESFPNPSDVTILP